MDKKEGNHSSGSRTSGSRGKEVIDCSSRKPFNVQWVYNVNIMEGRSHLLTNAYNLWLHNGIWSFVLTFKGWSGLALAFQTENFYMRL